MNPILITGGIKNLKNRSFGKNSKTGEKSAENFLPKISPEKIHLDFVTVVEMSKKPVKPLCKWLKITKALDFVQKGGKI